MKGNYPFLAPHCISAINESIEKIIAPNMEHAIVMMKPSNIIDAK